MKTITNHSNLGSSLRRRFRASCHATRLTGVLAGSCALLLVGCGGDRTRDVAAAPDSTYTPPATSEAPATTAPAYGATDPAAAPQTQAQQDRIAAAPAGAESDSARIVLHEEHLDVQKRQADAGGVVVSKDVVTEQVEVPVELQRERVEITHVPPREAGEAARTGEAFTEQQVYIPLEREEAVVQKDVGVRDVIDVETRTETEQQTVAGTVRREVADIDRPGEAQQSAATSRGEEFATTQQPGQRDASQMQQAGAGEQSQPRLETRIRQELRDADEIALDAAQLDAITIIAQQDMVILQGAVPSNEISQQIEQRVRDTDGVERVQNRLRIEASQPAAAE